MALKPLRNYDRYGTVEFNKQKITGFKEKCPTKQGHINGGTYILQKNKMPVSDWPDRFSFEKDLLEKEVSNFLFVPFISDSYFIDIGIPEDYAKANTDFQQKTL